MYYQLEIDQICRANPSSEAYSRWQKEESKFSNIDDLIERVKDLYGKIPFKKGNEIYVDKKDGKSEQVGFHYSFWEDEYGTNKKYFATDWITVFRVEKQPAVGDILQLA